MARLLAKLWRRLRGIVTVECWGEVYELRRPTLYESFGETYVKTRNYRVKLKRGGWTTFKNINISLPTSDLKVLDGKITR